MLWSDDDDDASTFIRGEDDDGDDEDGVIAIVVIVVILAIVSISIMLLIWYCRQDEEPMVPFEIVEIANQPKAPAQSLQLQSQTPIIGSSLDGREVYFL